MLAIRAPSARACGTPREPRAPRWSPRPGSATRGPLAFDPGALASGSSFVAPHSSSTHAPTGRSTHWSTTPSPTTASTHLGAASSLVASNPGSRREVELHRDSASRWSSPPAWSRACPRRVARASARGAWRRSRGHVRRRAQLGLPLVIGASARRPCAASSRTTSSPRRRSALSTRETARNLARGAAGTRCRGPDVPAPSSSAWPGRWLTSREDRRSRHVRPHDDAARGRDRGHHPPTDRIFVWGFSPWVYQFSHRRPAGRFVFETYVTGLVPWFREKLSIERARVVPGASRSSWATSIARSRRWWSTRGSIMMARPMRAYPAPFAEWLHAHYCYDLRIGAFDVYSRRADETVPCASPFPIVQHAFDFGARPMEVSVPQTFDAGTSAWLYQADRSSPRGSRAGHARRPSSSSSIPRTLGTTCASKAWTSRRRRPGRSPDPLGIAWKMRYGDAVRDPGSRELERILWIVFAALAWKYALGAEATGLPRDSVVAIAARGQRATGSEPAALVASGPRRATARPPRRAPFALFTFFVVVLAVADVSARAKTRRTRSRPPRRTSYMDYAARRSSGQTRRRQSLYGVIVSPSDAERAPDPAPQRRPLRLVPRTEPVRS